MSSSFWHASVNRATCSRVSSSFHPMSGAMSVGDGGGGVHGRLGALDGGRVRRDSTSSSVHAISSAAAYRTSAPGVGQAGHDGLEQFGAAFGQGEHVSASRAVAPRGGAHAAGPA